MEGDFFLGGGKKTTARFTKNDGLFYQKRRVTFLKTTGRFFSNNKWVVFVCCQQRNQGGKEGEREGGGEGKIIAQKHRKS